MTLTSRSLAALALALAAGTLAACGSSDSGGSSTLDRTALAAKADELCAAAPAAPQAPKDLAELVPFLQTLSDQRAKLYDQLAALTPDDATKAEWDAVLANYRQANTYVPKLLAAAKAKDGAAYRQQLAPWIAADRKASAAATRLGTTHC